MDHTQEKEYQELVRGVATYLLLGKSNPLTDPLSLANQYALDVEKVKADIDAIVRSEHTKVGGVFEILPITKSFSTQGVIP